MPIFKQYFFSFCLLLSAGIFLVGCDRIVERNVIVDNLIYGIDTVPVYALSADKTKLKTTTQFVSTAYTQLYLRPIPSSTLNDLSLLRLSNGDKNLIGELVISYFLDDDAVLATIPTPEEMWIDLDDFVEMTYLRFFLRLPGSYEKLALRRQIEVYPDTTPREVYRAFLLSNEYLYY